MSRHTRGHMCPAINRLVTLPMNAPHHILNTPPATIPISNYCSRPTFNPHCTSCSQTNLDMSSKRPRDTSAPPSHNDEDDSASNTSTPKKSRKPSAVSCPPPSHVPYYNIPQYPLYCLQYLPDPSLEDRLDARRRSPFPRCDRCGAEERTVVSRQERPGPRQARSQRDQESLGRHGEWQLAGRCGTE